MSRTNRVSDTSSLVCRNCGVGQGRVGKPLLVCSKCRCTHYCCADCQRAHWKLEHKEECPLLCEQKKSSSIGAQTLHDVDRWVTHNRTAFSVFITKLLVNSNDGISLISSHCVFLCTSYDNSRRAVTVNNATVISSEAAQELANSAAGTDMDPRR